MEDLLGALEQDYICVYCGKEIEELSNRRTQLGGYICANCGAHLDNEDNISIKGE